MKIRTFCVVALTLASFRGGAAEPKVEEILKRYDEIMAPRTFEAEAEMTAHREDGTTRTYAMKLLRGEGDRTRVWFEAPAAVKGQEMLRSGDNLWVYLPNIKRPTRMANRDSFQGGDFNNADVLRVNYQEDYTGQLIPADKPEAFLLSLKAKHPNTAYDSIKLWVRKKDLMPIRSEYYATSGALLRSAEFQKYTQFEPGYVRPAAVVMRNEQVKSRFTEMLMRRMKTNVTVPDQRFTLADLGR